MPKSQIQSLFTRISKSTFFKNVRSLLVSQFLKLAVQLLYFVILARTFGPNQYGAYVGVLAIISFFTPFSSWGSDWLLIQNVSRDQSLFSKYSGAAILKTLFFGSLWISLVLSVLSIYPIPYMSIYSVFLLALANLIFLPISDIYKQSFLGVGIVKYTSRIIIILSGNKLLASLILITLFEKPTLFIWSLLYCFATLVTAIIGTFMAIRVIGYPKFKLSQLTKDLAPGFAFSVGLSAEIINNDLDKTMLAKLSTVESVGIYGAAYQILIASAIPLQAMTVASFRNFFQKGASGIKGSVELAKKLMPMLSGYSVLAIIGIILFAPFLPKILGEEYSSSATAVMALSPVILIKSIQTLAADALTGANYQKARSAMQILAVCVNGMLNFWLIPLYQWRGAIWATITSEILLTVLLWSFVYICFQKSSETAV